ncbi:MAG: winged helix-turn-helix domain-containing protein [Candidatus Hodarchaeales archaeon]|jgi:DNA-binding transcriptional ArsR family regulator
MSSTSGSVSPELFRILQDETRLAIIICLQIYQQLTIKQLSDFLRKGKTTITHHLRKLEGEGIVKWQEKEEDRKKYRTRYFYISDENLKGKIGFIKKGIESSQLMDEDTVYRIMKTESSITSSLQEWMINFTEKQEEDNLQVLNERANSFIKTFLLTDETLPIYKEFEEKMAEAVMSYKSDGNQSSNITHISSHVFVPIKEILDWRQQSKKV